MFCCVFFVLDLDLLDFSCKIGNARPIFHVTSADRRCAFIFFVASFCAMKDYINPAKALDGEGYWISAKHHKAVVALCRAFPQAEWDVLSATIDSRIPEEDKQNPAQWLAKLCQHYLDEEPIIQRTHNFLGILKQAPGMSVQAWYTLMRLEYQKYNFPSAVDHRLLRDIFVIGLNYAFGRFRSDLISLFNLAHVCTSYF